MPTNHHAPRKHRLSATAPVLTAILILALPLGAYVAGYLWLGEYDEFFHSSRPHEPAFRQRTYRWRCLSAIYRPAGLMEGWLRGVKTCVLYKGQLGDELHIPPEKHDALFDW